MSNGVQIDKEKVFSQRNIWQVLALYQRSFPRPFPAFVHASFAFSICLAIFIPSSYFSSPALSEILAEKSFVRLVEVLSGVGISAGVGLLSVAIAGFAIFASGLDTKVSVQLLTRIRKSNGLPVILFVFSFFVYSLGTLLILFVSSVVCIAFSDQNGALYKLTVFTLEERSKLFFIVLFSAQIAQLTFTVSVIKSFVWNLYETLLTISAVRVDSELKARRTSSNRSNQQS